METGTRLLFWVMEQRNENRRDGHVSESTGKVNQSGLKEKRAKVFGASFRFSLVGILDCFFTNNIEIRHWMTSKGVPRLDDPRN
jgi:hypothetical protein